MSDASADLPKPIDSEASKSDAKGESQTETPSRPLPQTASRMDLVPSDANEREGTPMQPPSKEKEVNGKKREETEGDEERKAKLEQEIFDLNEQLTEAVSAVNLRPLGFDRYHQKYWIFPNLPGLFVEDSGDIFTSKTEPLQARKTDNQPQKENIPHDNDNASTQVIQAEKCLSPEGILVKSQPNPSFTLPPPAVSKPFQGAIIDLTKDSPTKPVLALPTPPPLIPISQTSLEQEDKLGTNNGPTITTATASATPVDKGGTDDHEGSLIRESAHISAESGPQWSFYKSQDEIDGLLNSLNPRGIREVDLKRIISEQRVHFEPDLSKCPFQSTDESALSRLPEPRYTSADQYLELYLREQILDIEEKIYLGSLGYLRDVEERSQWRNSIENSGAAAALDPDAPIVEETLPTTNDATLGLEVPKQGHSRSRSTTPFLNEDGSKRKASPPVNLSVHELSRALLQVQAGIEKKYLLPPLGMAIDHKKRQRQKKKDKKVIKESDLCTEEWCASLAKATSFSQIFVHLATLERCVMWSKSLMNVRCRICRRKCGDEFMLLCDGCDHGYHTYCLKPPLKDVPEGDWFCYDCNPVTPVKPRRRVQRVVIIEEESSESEEEQEVQESEDEEEGSDQEDMDDENEDSEEEEAMSTKRVLRSAQTRSSEVAVSSRRGSKGKASTQSNAKSQAKVAKGKGKLSKVMQKKPEVGIKRPRGRPPGSSRKQKSSSVTPDSSNSRGSSSARKKLKLDSPPPPVHQSKAESVIASIIELRCSSSSSSRSQTSSSRREQKSLETQLCEALWEEINEEDDSVHFEIPVKKREVSSFVCLFF